MQRRVLCLVVHKLCQLFVISLYVVEGIVHHLHDFAAAYRIHVIVETCGKQKLQKRCKAVGKLFEKQRFAVRKIYFCLFELEHVHLAVEVGVEHLLRDALRILLGQINRREHPVASVVKDTARSAAFFDCGREIQRRGLRSVAANLYGVVFFRHKRDFGRFVQVGIQQNAYKQANERNGNKPHGFVAGSLFHVVPFFPRVGICRIVVNLSLHNTTYAAFFPQITKGRKKRPFLCSRFTCRRRLLPPSLSALPPP